VTALCGGGSSGPQPGVQTAVAVGSIGVEAFITALGFPEVAPLVASFIAAALTIDSASYCSTDPPSDPGLVAGDIADAINFTEPEISIPAQAKIVQWFLSQYWCKICQCSTGVIPSCGTPSSPGPVSSSPGLPSGTTGTPCWDVTANETTPSGTVLIDYSADLVPTTTSHTITAWSTGAPTTAYTLPPGITSLATHGISQPVSGGDFGLAVYLIFYNSSGTGVGLLQILTDSTGVGVDTTLFPRSIPSTAVYWQIQAQGNSNGIAINWSMEVQFFCPGSGVNDLTTSCCPPDPLLEASLQQILGLVQQIYSMIPVRVPNYAAGTAHSGLTGGGNITLDATTIAVLVTVTQLPDVYSEIAGFPNTYIGIGWITPANNEGPGAGIAISRTSQTIQLPEATSSLDYSLPSGETITVTELQAG
jgi:hypothetical protein